MGVAVREAGGHGRAALACFPWMRIGRAVEYTGLPRAVIDGLVDSGAVRWFKTGGGRGCCKFVRVEDIAEWMDAGAVSGKREGQV